MDLPLRMESDMIENADGPGPYGAKGMSEGALLPVAPAVAAAVARRDRRRDPGPAALARAGLAGAPGARADVRRTYPLGHAFELPREDVLALVGGKAANLGEMLGLGLPVPPGFVVTTETCRAFLAGGWPDGLDDELRARMAEVEAAVGRRFGDAADPLLVSVRSGAPVSMPGMMDTILDLGLNDATERGLAAATGDPAFAAECHDRFRSMFRSIVGVDDVPDDPWEQLRLAISAVFRSWNSDRARAYRRRESIPDDLGTAVTVQAMVFGNLGADSATGVAFTRNPATGEPVLYGDVLFDAQGEDVVAGTHATEPIAALDERLPSVGAELRDVAGRLERHYADLCDIEFTVERGRLWMLQVRVGKRSPAAALRIAVDMAEDPSFPLSRREALERVAYLLADPPTVTTGRSGYLLPLATGLGASPGVASGEIATSPEAAERAAEAGRTVVLVRAETSPDDVHGMSLSAGILTARGGLASHAAVVARGWGIPAVVGASGIEVRDGEVGDRRADVPRRRHDHDRRRVGRGVRGRDPGPDGARAAGPDAARLGRGARRPDRRRRRAAAPGRACRDAGAGSGDARQLHPAARDEGLRDDPGARGFAPHHAGSRPAAARPAGRRRRRGDGRGRVPAHGGGHESRRGAGGGRPRRVGRRAGDGGPGRVPRARPSDEGDRHRLAAQARPRRRPPTQRPRATRPTTATSSTGWPRSARTPTRGSPRSSPRRRGSAVIGERLARALERARAGDGKYVASPRVDSFHGAWFELHEDLIVLAGRTRADEAAAGRA